MFNIVILSTNGPNNAQTVFQFAQNTENVTVVHLFSDNPCSPSFRLADEFGVDSTYIKISGNISEENGLRERIECCDALNEQLVRLELKYGRIDLIVCAFQKILKGKILTDYNRRIINVHPADLSVYDIQTRLRRYVGRSGLERAFLDGVRESRTTIHYVDDGIDTGEIVTLGPFVKVKKFDTPYELEIRQKQESDKVALGQALALILLEGKK